MRLVSIMPLIVIPDRSNVLLLCAMSRLSTHVYYLKYLSVATRYQRRHLLQTATAEQLNVLYEIIWNTHKGNLSLTEKDYNKLYKHKNVLRKLASREIDPYTKRGLISKNSIVIKDLLCVFFHYYTHSHDFSSEEEEEEEEELQSLQDSTFHHVERKWVPEINFDSSVAIPSTSTVSEQSKSTDSPERDPM